MRQPNRKRRLAGCAVAAAVCGLIALVTGWVRSRPPVGPTPVTTTPVGTQPGDVALAADARPDQAEPADRPPQRGLVLHTAAACPGYTLFTPLNSTTTYLVDVEGQLVHSWPSKFEPGMAVYLLDDGSILRAGREPGNHDFGGGGLGGRVERIAPDGAVMWTYVCADEHRCQHHDIEPLPNGHVLLIAWEKKSRDEVLAAGGDPEEMPDGGLWPDCVLEVAPEGATGGKIVWEWHVWDHLVQEYDEDKPNYGLVAEHPELVDLNYQRTAPRESPEEMRRLRSLGYVGGDAPEEPADPQAGHRPPGPGGPDMRADWCHTNSVAYHAELDQIVLSVHSFNEIWIIDHSTTTAEAAGRSGGQSGRGGDLLYRWGNPRAYGAGDVEDQQLFAQHDACWIPAGYPGAGHLTVFNNGPGRPDGHYSSVIEIVPPVDRTGRYHLDPGRPFGPATPLWEYTAEKQEDFFSSHISGAHRLPNGDTLICAGEQGRIFEVDVAGQTVWDYVNPYIERDGRGEKMRPPGMRPGGARPPRRRPDGQQGVGSPKGHPPGPPPPGFPFFGPPPGGPGGPPGGGGGLFRATRVGVDHPGVQVLLSRKAEQDSAGG